jgi:hypothetical protein
MVELQIGMFDFTFHCILMKL